MLVEVTNMYTKDELAFIVPKAKSYADVLRLLNRKTSGSAHKYIRKIITKYNINVSHFENKIPTKNNRLSYKDILIKSDKKRHTHQLRRALIESGKKYICEKCKNYEWCGQNLVLEIHHIDGDNTNNLIENLQFLCPNCHSQTSNFYRTKYQKFCACGNPVYKKYTKCHKCSSSKEDKIYLRKVDRPDKEQLSKLIWEKPSSQIAKDFGVTDKSIEKWCKRYGLSKPPRGYWSKKRPINCSG